MGAEVLLQPGVMETSCRLHNQLFSIFLSHFYRFLSCTRIIHIATWSISPHLNSLWRLKTHQMNANAQLISLERG